LDVPCEGTRVVVKKTTQKNPSGLFLKSPLKKPNTTHQKTHFLFFQRKNLLRSKNQIGRTLVQLTLTFFNQTKRTEMKFEGFEKNN